MKPKQSEIGVTAPFSRSKVDIIIPFHGQYEKVTRLVESILYLTRSNPYQICLVDDASPNKEYLKYFDSVKENYQIKTVRNKKHLGFGASLKTGFDATVNPWVIFLHSDCVIESAGWMIEMGRTLLKMKDRGVKMVCARTNNSLSADPLLTGSREDEVNDQILHTTMPLYCAMCHRELFRHIGGFIKPYPYAMYEDEELSFRMKKYGYLQAVCGKSWVYHEGGATINSLCKARPAISCIMDENRELCIHDMKKL